MANSSERRTQAERALAREAAEWCLRSSSGASGSFIRSRAARTAHIRGARSSPFMAKLYGTTFAGGAQGKGTFFSVTPSGKEQVLYSFKGAPDDGAGPLGSLAEVSGALYGVTERGGQDNAGTVFHFQPSGVEELVHSFDPATDGSAPTGLVNFPDSDTMYGTAAGGGAHKLGTLFYVLAEYEFPCGL